MQGLSVGNSKPGVNSENPTPVAPTGWAPPGGSNPEDLSFDFFLRAQIFYKFLENCTCPNLEVLRVPEALVYSIGILEAPGVFLARRWLKS